MDADRNVDAEELASLVLDLMAKLAAETQLTKAFSVKWQSVRNKLQEIQKSMETILSSKAWTENPLMAELLPKIWTTLSDTRELARSCRELSFPGKLLMQSDLDVAVTKLSFHQRDLNVLIESGVLNLISPLPHSAPAPGASIEEVRPYTRDLIARLQIGSPEIRHQALDSLVKLLQEEKTREVVSIVVADEGPSIACLARLLHSENSQTMENALFALSTLAQNIACRCAIAGEGISGLLMRILDSGASVQTKETAVNALELITRDDFENCCAVAAHERGVQVLVKLCCCEVPELQAAGATLLRNLCVLDDLRHSIQEENGLPILIKLINSKSSLPELEAAAECVQTMAADDEVLRITIARIGGAESLIEVLLNSKSQRALEVSLQAIKALTLSTSASDCFVSSSKFMNSIPSLLKEGTPAVQLLTTSIICNLLHADDSTRKAFGEAGCISLLAKLLGSKSHLCQEEAVKALSILLSLENNRHEFIKDNDGLISLVHLLDAENQSVPKDYPLAALLALSSCNSGRKKIVSCGASPALEKLAEMEFRGAKKVLHKIAGSKFRKFFSSRW